VARTRAPARPPSGATATRVRRSRSGSANQATRALRASVDALTAKAARGSADRLDPTRWALRYLQASRPTSVLAPAPLSAEERAKVPYVQADRMVRVIRSVLESLELSEAEYAKGIALASKALRAEAAGGWEPL
jgi:hypothetical protein